MSGHQHATLEDTVYFWFASNDTSGSGGDGATPLFDVREAGAAAGAIPLLSGTPTLLTHANFPAGCHEVAVAATAVNGFAADDTFAVFCTLAVDSQNPTGFVGSCTLTPLAKTAALATAQTDLDTITGAAGVVIDDSAANDTTISDAVWDEAQADHVAAASFGVIATEIAAIPTTAMRGTDGANTTTPLSAAQVNAEVDTALNTAIPGTPTAGSINDIIKDLDAVLPVTAISTVTTAQVNTEVDNALNVTTYPEPGQELPPATASLQQKISYSYKGWRNRSNQTATKYQLFGDDATTVHQKATISDDGTTAEKGEIATGP